MFRYTLDGRSELYRVGNRGKVFLNLNQYLSVNYPELCYRGGVELEQPKEEQYILRMLIKRPFIDYKIPEELMWCKPVIDIATDHQHNNIKIIHPFVYLTIRKGKTRAETNDEWHVDGFSQTFTHLPEQNYLWVDKYPTECALKSIEFPRDFDPNKHNLHLFIQDKIKEGYEGLKLPNKFVTCLDPYVIHRRPQVPEGEERCFIRVSFTPIEIEDVNNTYNPLLHTNYTRDGVKEFRDKLVDYHKQ